ncbi:hypothetical protein [Nonomuraea sediminis]|uniref:hypothetical protein n=1 Tax=Nonomuraea sediminis TaxID=2835864 RepID=UPI001BDDA523|nr:hypothetical protein [Nonomuraea sediminis]
MVALGEDVFGYTGAMGRYTLAAAMASSAAYFLRRPSAWGIAAAITATTADPHSVSQAAVQLRTEDKGGQTKEIAQIETEVTKLLDFLKDEAKYAGTTADVVRGQLTKFLEETKKVPDLFNAPADTLDAAAKKYNALSYVALGLATALWAWRILEQVSWCTWVNPAARMTYEVSKEMGLRALWAIAKPLLGKAAMFATAAGGLFTYVMMKSQEQAMHFNDVKASLPADFSGTGLAYDPKSGMVPKSVGQSQIPGINVDSSLYPA